MFSPGTSQPQPGHPDEGMTGVESDHLSGVAGAQGSEPIAGEPQFAPEPQEAGQNGLTNEIVKIGLDPADPRGDYWTLFIQLWDDQAETVQFTGQKRPLAEVVKSSIRILFEGYKDILTLEEAYDLMYECHKIVHNRVNNRLDHEAEKLQAQEGLVNKLQSLQYRLIQTQ